ncbi:MAG: cytochrome c biogenesis protein CcsA [Bradymonadales bacterium]|nr:cytochrome c biogenesis protein CcsA [Bradymonadales bacterium]
MIALWAAIASFWAAIASVGRGRWRYRLVARQGVYLVFGGVAVASAALLHAFVTHDFSLKVVFQYSDRAMPGLYLVAALWGGQQGSLLLWALALTGFSAAVVAGFRSEEDELAPWIMAVLMAIAAFFLLLLLFVSNPFERFYALRVPRDGQGLNPLLQNLWMAFHPPVLLVGFASFAIPFAHGIAALITGRLDGSWLRRCEGWTLLSWALMGLGSLLGARWAYQELGWGGYWSWDPVENAALLPWLTATGVLHAGVGWKRRGWLGRWTLVLLVVTFWLTIFGTFLTRSGFVSSVHAFARSPIGLYFLVFLLLLLALFGLLLGWRWKDLRAAGQSSPAVPYGHWSIWLLVGLLVARQAGWGLGLAIGGGGLLLSYWLMHRKTAGSGSPVATRGGDAGSARLLFWLTMLILAGFTFGVLWGTISPTLFQLIAGTSRQIGVGWFSQLAVDAGLCLLLVLWACNVTRGAGSEGRRSIRFLAVIVMLSAILAAVLGGTFYLARLQYRREELEMLWVVEAGLALFLCMLNGVTILVGLRDGLRAGQRTAGGSVWRGLRTVLTTRRRWVGAQIAHLGLVALLFSMIGNGFEVQHQIEIDQGRSASVGGYRVTYGGIEARQFPTHLGVFARLSVQWCGGAALPVDRSACSTPRELQPARFDYNAHRPGETGDPNQVTNEIAFLSGPLEDFYVTLGGFSPDGQTAFFEVHINPLMFWLWWGGALLFGGVLLGLWPVRPRVPAGATANSMESR